MTDNWQFYIVSFHSTEIMQTRMTVAVGQCHILLTGIKLKRNAPDVDSFFRVSAESKYRTAAHHLQIWADKPLG